MCFAADEDLCTLEKLRAQGADTLLDRIAGVVPFDSRSFFLYESQAGIVRGRAVSRLCNGNERWILYDPAWTESLKQKDGNSDLPVYFVLAHEAAHHVLGHTLLVQRDWDVDYWGPQQELAADETAAVWVTRALRPSKEELLRAFDSLGLPEQADLKAGYPSRAARRERVIQGYEEETARIVPGPTGPNTSGGGKQPADPFRDALLRRIEEVSSTGKASTNLPGASNCEPGVCHFMDFGKDSTEAGARFRNTRDRIEAALSGLGWTGEDVYMSATAGQPAAPAVMFGNSTVNLTLYLVQRPSSIDIIFAKKTSSPPPQRR
jgi:hypothetical protein